MGILDSLEKRRSVYALNKELPVAQEEVITAVERAAELVPDAFDMKSARVVIALGEKQDMLWDAVYDAFGGKLSREKTDSFKAAAGTVLYFTDSATVKAMQEKFASYAANFPVWAGQANGMLQLAVWTALRDMGIGANIQHYNPVIDESVRKLFGVPQDYALIAQMPFGGISAEPEAKEKEDISKRVRTAR